MLPQASGTSLTMKHKGQRLSILRLQACFWLFLLVCLLEQQNVFSSEASDKDSLQRGAPAPLAANYPPDDSMARLHAQLTAQRELTNSQFSRTLFSRKHIYAVAMLVLFLVIMKATAVRKKKKRGERVKPSTEELEEGTQPSGEQADDTTQDMDGSEPEDSGALGEPDDDFHIDRPLKRSRTGRKETMRKDRHSGDGPFAEGELQEIGEEGEEGELVQQPGLPPPTETITDPTLQQQFPEPPPPGPDSGLTDMGYMGPTDMVSLPPFGAPGMGPGMVADEDGELQELRVRRNVISNLADTAMRLADELAGDAAALVINSLKANVEAAEKAERDYDIARSHGDPNLPAIRNDVVNIMSVSISGARDCLMNLVALAKEHGEHVRQYCSEGLFFTHVERLRQPLHDSLESKAIKLCAASLASVGNTSTTLQQENEDQLRLLREAQFIDECEAQDVVQVFGAVAAMNARMKALQRLAALDSALMEDMLAMHREWMRWKLHAERIPLEMDANLVQGLHSLLSKTRPPVNGQPASGITDADLQGIKELFDQQSQDMNALDTARDAETVTAAYERGQTISNKLRYLVQLQKEKLHAVIQKQSLNKEETAAVSDTMAKLAESAIMDTEDLLRLAQSAYSEVSDKNEDTLASGGKGLLQKLTTKIKSTTTEAGEDGASSDSSPSSTVKKYFSEPFRQTESAAKDIWLKAQEAHASAKKTKKFKLDKDGLGSTAWDKKTNLRVEAATKRAEAAINLHRFRYLHLLAKEFVVLEEMISSVLMFPFQPTSGALAEVRKLKAAFDSEKAMIRDAQCNDVIPEYTDTMEQIAWKMWNLLETERQSQLKDAVQRVRVHLHNLAPE